MGCATGVCAVLMWCWYGECWSWWYSWRYLDVMWKSFVCAFKNVSCVSSKRPRVTWHSDVLTTYIETLRMYSRERFECTFRSLNILINVTSTARSTQIHYTHIVHHDWMSDHCHYHWEGKKRFVKRKRARYTEKRDRHKNTDRHEKKGTHEKRESDEKRDIHEKKTKKKRYEKNANL